MNFGVLTSDSLGKLDSGNPQILRNGDALRSGYVIRFGLKFLLFSMTAGLDELISRHMLYNAQAYLCI
jgi:hypothetical protein